MQRTIRFYLDFISPYSYVAWTQIPGLAARHGCALEAVPVLFAGLLDAHGTKGPAEVPAKRRYVLKDAARKAARFGVPIDAPFAHPFNPLLALRLASLPELQDADRVRLIDVLYRATWAERRDVTSPEVLSGLLHDAGVDPSLLEKAASAESKQRVRDQTNGAIAAGVFGVPTTLVDGEMFWGTDSLVDLERFLEGRDPVPIDLAERWESLPAAARRPGSLKA